ncbi:hypothetical protein C1H46_002863 [Malus baccata]|uniref:Uncharacterized protein n=1 Tax=Malus baccata TaxID=106549 RepID=A0A540NKC8_MALBA|nr:hypothetical protein C1H46_002863 [Malus baccata]
MALIPFGERWNNPPSTSGVNVALSLGILSFAAISVALIPVKERWSNTPSTGDVDGALPLGFLAMFQGIIPLIWGLLLKLFQNFESTLQPLTPVTAIHSRFGGSHLNTSLLLYLCFPPIEGNDMFSPYQGLDLFE